MDGRLWRLPAFSGQSDLLVATLEKVWNVWTPWQHRSHCRTTYQQTRALKDFYEQCVSWLLLLSLSTVSRPEGFVLFLPGGVTSCHPVATIPGTCCGWAHPLEELSPAPLSWEQKAKVHPHSLELSQPLTAPTAFYRPDFSVLTFPLFNHLTLSQS